MAKRSRVQSPEPTAQGPRSTPAPWPWALGLVAAVVLVYAGGVNHPFIFDDVGAIALNPQIRSLSPSVALSPPAETPVGGRPLVNLALALNYAAGGLDVQGYHVVNIALHAVCAVLVFGLVGLVTRRVTGSPGRIFPFMVALIWAVHPLNSEAVNYMTQRTELMMAACYLLTLYASARVTPGVTGRRWMFVAIVANAAGMACKESMVSAPILVLLFDRVYRYTSFRDAWRERSSLYLGLMAGWIVLMALMWSVPRTTSSGFATTHVSSWTYLLNQTEMIVRYFRLAVWPDSLVLYYGWATPTTLAAVWPYGVAIVGLLAASVGLFLRAPRVGFLALWCFFLLAPTSSIVPIGSEVGAERRMYLPLIGLVTLAAAGVVTLTGRRRVREGVAIGLVIAAAFGYRTMERTTEYATALGMAQTVLERWPTPTAHYMVGTELITAGRPADAVSHLRQAAVAIPPARFNLGSALIAVNQQAEGITELEAFLRAEPGLVSSRDARLLLARAYTDQQRTGDVVAILAPLLGDSTSDHAAHGLMAESLVASGRHAEAFPHYEAYLRIEGRDAAAWTGLGIALMSSARPTDGVSAFRQAVAFAPGDPGYRMNLARALIDTGDAAAALEHARMAVQLTQGDPAAVELLRAAGGR